MEKVYQDEDFCENCTSSRKERGLFPFLLVELPNGTLRRNLAVKVCPYCDGGAADLGMENESI